MVNSDLIKYFSLVNSELFHWSIRTLSVVNSDLTSGQFGKFLLVSSDLTNVYKLSSDNEFLTRIFDCWEAGKISSIQ